jgi:hypothetical protein
MNLRNDEKCKKIGDQQPFGRTPSTTHSPYNFLPIFWLGRFEATKFKYDLAVNIDPLVG